MDQKTLKLEGILIMLAGLFLVVPNYYVRGILPISFFSDTMISGLLLILAGIIHYRMDPDPIWEEV